MTTSLTSSRARFPDSVQEFFKSWGGCSAPQRVVDGCIEKRLELDLRHNITPATIDPREFAVAMQEAGDGLSHHRVTDGRLVLTFQHIVMLVTERCVLVLSDSSVHLHAALEPLCKLLEKYGVEIEWASFMRMNLNSPFDETSKSSIMAQEYAALKSVFPSGHPYLTGAIDRDHFFYFIYDNIERNIPNARREEDVQVNVYMHNVKSAVQNDSGNYEPLKSRQVVILLRAATEYEVFRISAEENDNSMLSFETNTADLKSCNERVLEIIEMFSPDRFSMMVLQDRESHLANRRQVFVEVRGYSIMSRAVNHFGEGYAFHQAVYVRVM